MKKIIIALAATSALGMAAPAAAQYAGGSFEARLSDLQAEIQAGVRSGGLTRAEAAPLREQLRQLRQLERHYARDGLSRGERNDLQLRLQNLRQQIRVAARTGGGRWDDRYDRDDRYGRGCPPGLEKKNNGCLPPGQVGRDDRNGRWDDDDDRDGRQSWIDRNRDGYDDRDLNHDRRIDAREWEIARDAYGRGRWEDRDDDRWEDRDDRWDDRDDRWDDRDQRRGGLSGVLDRVLGGGGLRVGQRVTASARLGPVPYEYRSRFRDGNGVYYRSDGRSVYEIDARTDVVLRIYALNR